VSAGASIGGVPLVRTSTESPLADAPVPVFTHAWPGALGMVHGLTGRGGQPAPVDMGLFGDPPVRTSMSRWRALREWAGCRTAIHARQVHGAHVLLHDATPDGLLVAEGADGHVTTRKATLLTVSLADCVPVFIVDPERHAIALLHSGWRGTAAGITERGIAALAVHAASDPGRLLVHVGPAICGECYEVGPEVHERLGLAAPSGPKPVDLRAVIVRRALGAGVIADHITVSTHCTRCGDGSFFSHRGGDTGRFVAFLAIADPDERSAAAGRQ
jgi:YfiH family protein